MRNLKILNFHLTNFASPMDEDKTNRLYQIFMEVDDFCKSYETYLKQHSLPSATRRRSGPQAKLSLSEIMTLAIFYHQSGFRCFQYYYEDLVLGELKTYFPQALSYNRFVERLPHIGIALYLFSQWCCLKAQRTGIYFADSKNSRFVTINGSTPIGFLKKWQGAEKALQAGFMGSNCIW